MLKIASVFVGDVFKSNQGCLVEVVHYENSKNVWVQYQDSFGYIAKCYATDLRLGKFKNPYYTSVEGIGYLGVGSFRCWSNGSMSKAYITWRHMIIRGYNKKYKTKYPTYKDCTVDKEWHNFQVFAKWYTRHEFYGLGYELDKDILVRGNKVYSANTCSLVPKQVNYLLLDKYNFRGDYPVGITKNKLGGNFAVKVSLYGKNNYLGSFTDLKEACGVYKKAKESYVKEVALFWQGRIEDKVFEKLMKWTVVF